VPALDDAALELLRSSSGLAIDAEGRFLHRGVPITHARTLEVLWRSLERAADGRYLVRIGRESAYVTLEATPYAVRGLGDRAPGEAPLLLLSDGTRERLDPETLSLGADGVLRCVVKGGHEARFTRAGQLALGTELEEDPAGSGGYAITVGGRRFVIRPEPHG
jgi:hypothetical protein